MFLIEYEEGLFINGESISWLSIGFKDIRFTIGEHTQERACYIVGKGYESVFLNRLEILNCDDDIELIKRPN